ncbi:Eukaryotic translation initiation factor 4B [Elasticomyces elasticus]|uniref:Eukaryotic translation initiation factor 4B n=1 Tax=Elasticomyces elasticus TaxID=574655 RepID=A0AAN8A523_9PEZI|nr:Eukaryotic translation initiation factor 4B [Elasticomyces elasticus]KAK3641649.1 Eukaryotic translation initiation factor 4B [Elasticomyces elasticus]KAK4906064.1 Eukaryotic translation initiation factor 4B [Elasticomyces elasticus]KAK5706460.1 Eukaryotic translation initiation factor 4B [Elasticomyces elasticus]KAK5743717.1 Eukaryotic translation initiation factor 4B [Elasticomyces elasticus]
MAPKKKQEKMNLGEFLTNQSLGSWADEMDAQPLPSAPSGYASRSRDDRGGDRDGGEKRSFTQPSWENARTGSGMGGGMSGGMSGGSMRGMGDRNASYDERPRFSDREQLPFPTRPPYTAHLGNLAYDVSQVDLEGFLSECQVTSVRIVEDKFDHKPKGFGYVEFSTPEGLTKALAKSESSFMGRNIKISIAEPPKDRPEQTRDFTDWSRKGPLPDLPQAGRQASNRSFSRNFDERSDAGGDRSSSRRPMFAEGDGKTRDFSNWERKGPLSPAPGAGPPMRDGGRLREGPADGERTRSPAWGEGKSDAGSRPPRREFEPARPVADRAPTAAEQDSQWRTKMRPDAPSPAATPEASAPASPAAAQAPKERPRLNLAKRTVSTAEQGASSPAAPSATESKASPFGAAKPIDTAAKDREVEEKRELAVRQKQEADQKAREEKATQDAAARTARAERADRGQATEEGKVASPTGKGPTGPPRRPSRQQNGAKPAQPKENGDAAPQKERASFSILQHEDDAAAAEDGEGAEDAVDAPANGEITGDKETKPQEIVKELSKDASGGATQGAETTAETMEEDGWSTVSAKPKNSRRGGARALAS